MSNQLPGWLHQSKRIDSWPLQLWKHESYQSVKYHLKNANQSAKEMFHREDVKNSAVDTTLAHYLRTASASYRAKLKSKNKAQQEKAARLGAKMKVAMKKKTAILLLFVSVFLLDKIWTMYLYCTISVLAPTYLG